MILASHQPDFFPWMGYFYKFFRSDIFVFSDNVQYSKTGRHNYNDILTANGPQRFTLPIHYHCADLDKIEIAADDRSIEKMLKTLRFAYSKAKHFDEVYPVLEFLLRQAPEATSLADFNIRCILDLCIRMGLVIDCQGRRAIYQSSRLPLKKRRDERIIEMCQHLKADVYLSGSGAKDYHIEEDYKKAGIQLVYSDYCPLEYPQTFCGHKGEPEFVAPNLSVIDYLMNCGFTNPWEVRK